MFAPNHRDLLIACLWASLAVVAVAATDNTILRTVLCVPVAILVCGHTVLRAIGIGAASRAEHLAYAVGASLVVGIAGGMALNAAGLLSPLGWAVWFWLAVVGSSLTAARRGGPAWTLVAAPDVRRWHVGAVVLSVLVATGAYALAVRDETAQRQFKYTEFWLLPSEDGGQLRVGVRSGEEKGERFDLDVILDGQPLATFRSVEVAPGQTWTRELPVAPAAVSRRAVARLFRPDDNRLYRSASALLTGR
ncbi:MAG: hypothetical protein JWR89_764 [Tardiphaga sp.]|jgi:hypothetical protein|uniref:hypothetical protein n=1 Tax=Tardiphaga sp. TaxID=1926292 RepID=UPI00263756E4|nr:hypothetical protein [Tardiphaga sp.]MDB5500862.1 hypothetical protein [Tardiphaga sp.]